MDIQPVPAFEFRTVIHIENNRSLFPLKIRFFYLDDIVLLRRIFSNLSARSSHCLFYSDAKLWFRKMFGLLFKLGLANGTAQKVLNVFVLNNSVRFATIDTFST